MSIDMVLISLILLRIGALLGKWRLPVVQSLPHSSVVKIISAGLRRLRNRVSCSEMSGHMSEAFELS
jgi:hypothetical protein